MTEDKAKTNRRDFLKLAATGAPVAVVAAVAGGPEPLAAGPEPIASEGLQKTEHVKKYLESARF